LQNIKKNAALLNEQRKLTSTISAGLERTRTALASLEARLAAKEADRASYTDLVSRAKEIESAHRAWQKARKELETLDKVAVEFHDHQTERAALQEQIAVEKARLEEERDLLWREEIKSRLGELRRDRSPARVVGTKKTRKPRVRQRNSAAPELGGKALKIHGQVKAIEGSDRLMARNAPYMIKT
jgi:DNA repair exonuclease SbcCD ATPase subunit